MNKSRLAIAAGLISEAIVILGLLISIFVPNRRFWPPGERSWAYGLYWLCGIVVTTCAAVIGYLDRDSFEIDLPRRYSI